MTALQGAALGAVQGLTEFLPVSSSAHLVLAPRLLGWEYQGLAFDVALHMGTLAALLLYFHEDWLRLGTAAALNKDCLERRLFWGIALGSVPAAAAGLALQDRVEALFHGTAGMAVLLMAFGALLGAADRWGRREAGLEGLTPVACLAVGCAQALALMPGVSRSGVTITAALALGLRRDAAARFSFLLGTPIVLGAGLLKLKGLSGEPLGAPFWAGVAASAVTGVAAIRLLLRWTSGRGLLPFAVYRLLLGAALLAGAGTAHAP